MNYRNKEILSVLEAAIKLIDVKWVAWLHRMDGAWMINDSIGLDQHHVKFLENFCNVAEISQKISADLQSQNHVGEIVMDEAGVTTYSKVYFFPVSAPEIFLIAGANLLDKDTIRFLEALAGLVEPQPDIDVSVHQFLENFLQDFEGGISYELQSALDRISRILSRYVPSDLICVGLRYGDSLRVETVWPLDVEIYGQQISSTEGSIQKIVSERSFVIVDDLSQDRNFPLASIGDQIKQGSWLGVPLGVGKRVIGVIIFYSKQTGAFTQMIAKQAAIVAAHMAPAVETSMALAEATMHLEKQALLNELASAASIGIDTDEVAARIIDRLKRIFNTELVSILLLSFDGKMLNEFGDNYLGDHPLVIPTDSSLAGYVAETGQPYRTGDVATAPRYYHLTDGVHSELAVPLKFRGKVIGVLDLESREPEAFSLRDEQLLVVMASQLAGLIENVRLHDETRQRARNLDLIHQVIRDIVGLTRIPQIAQVTAELMAERFAFELTLVILVDERGEYLVVEGIGGNASPEIARGLKRPIDVGIAGLVCQDGVSRLVNDTSLEPAYDPLPGWPSGSEMCVPLWDGELIFGVLVVERSRKDGFTENDLMVLESLAGVLSSVMINALSYQQLNVNLRHLQAVRETALDISADLDLDTLLQRVTSRARELVGAKGAELGLVNEENRTVEIKVSENPWEGYEKGLVIPFNQGISGMMAVNGQSLAVDDYEAWAGGLRLDNPPPFKAVAGVPLKYKGKVIGTLTISHDEPNRGFDPNDIRLLELLAPQVAVSVRNARLYQELQTLMEAERLAKDRLIRSARLAAVGELSAGVAHELNNPLTTVAGFVELVLEDLPADSHHRVDLELVLKEARRAREVVRRLLDFSRPGEGFRVRADINDLIGDVVALIHHLLHTHGIELKTDLQDNITWIQVDRDQIKQVLLNLVHNAIHAMPRGGTLTLKTQTFARDGMPGVKMQILDTGIGISQENIERLFEPFFTTRPLGQGTGLGLSVSYGIVTDHGGFIDVESTPGQGSVFTVWLPEQSQRVLI